MVDDDRGLGRPVRVEHPRGPAPTGPPVRRARLTADHDALAAPSSPAGSTDASAAGVTKRVGDPLARRSSSASSGTAEHRRRRDHQRAPRTERQQQLAAPTRRSSATRNAAPATSGVDAEPLALLGTQRFARPRWVTTTPLGMPVEPEV